MKPMDAQGPLIELYLKHRHMSFRIVGHRTGFNTVHNVVLIRKLILNKSMIGYFTMLFLHSGAVNHKDH